ncbi:TonB C-terminal domain-containing protein [Rhodopseudomonas sp. RCAM05734]|uniref:TonB C-terminal domain-containing protein n=1 Tax=Rhodopseudomonas sp. RCAM05734 TaxID=3457549 RepID=UPI004044F46C
MKRFSAKPEISEQAGERKSLLRYGAALAVIALLVGGVVAFLGQGNDAPPPKQVRELTVVNILPPPPPPPPMIEQPKVIDQPKMVEQEMLEDKPVEKPVDDPVKDAKNEEPPGPLALDAKAVGPADLFNLGSKVGGSPYGGRGGGGSRWGWYASIVQTQIEAALRGNDKTKHAVMRLQVRLWADATGRISRVELVSSTGNAELDATIRNDVLGRLTLREPPPNDMPMPMVTRVTARKPT